MTRDDDLLVEIGVEEFPVFHGYGLLFGHSFHVGLFHIDARSHSGRASGGIVSLVCKKENASLALYALTQTSNCGYDDIT